MAHRNDPDDDDPEFDDLVQHLLRGQSSSTLGAARANERQQQNDQRRHTVSSEVNRVLGGDPATPMGTSNAGGAANDSSRPTSSRQRVRGTDGPRLVFPEVGISRGRISRNSSTGTGGGGDVTSRGGGRSALDGGGFHDHTSGARTRKKPVVLPSVWDRAHHTMRPDGGFQSNPLLHPDGGQQQGKKACKAEEEVLSITELIDKLGTPDRNKQRLEEIDEEMVSRAPISPLRHQQGETTREAVRNNIDHDDDGIDGVDVDNLSNPNPQGSDGAQPEQPEQQQQEAQQLEEGEEGGEEGFIEHEVHAFGSYNLVAKADKIEGQQTLHNRQFARLELFGHTLLLFSAITTIMIIGANIRAKTSESTRERVGGATIDILTNALAYGPLPFFALLVLRVNNHFAERVYYKFLQRGGIIDFPRSDHATYLKRPEPIAFIGYFFVYFIFATVVIILVEAPTSDALLFYNNIVAGVALFWFRQQSIEPYFISLTRYIESFPDTHGNYHNIDATSLYSAATQALKVKLFDAKQPSYRGEMRDAYFRYKHFTPRQQRMVLCGVYTTVLLFMLVGILYVIFMGRVNHEGFWTDTINPCVDVCILVDPAKTTAPSSSAVTGSLLTRDPTRCAMCMCRCFKSMEMSLEALIGTCPTQFVVQGCTADAVTCDASRCHAIHAMGTV